MDTFYTYRVKWLPMEIANKIWRWQYTLRKKIERKIKLFFYKLKRLFTKPKLYGTCSNSTRC